jgi:hypothetical protein
VEGSWSEHRPQVDCFLVACDAATNSASALLRVTPPCRELRHDPAPPLRLKRYPIIDLSVSGSAAKSRTSATSSMSLPRLFPGFANCQPATDFSPHNSLFCSVLRASRAPSSSPPALTVSHRCSRVVQEALGSSRMLQLTPCGTSRWPLGTKSGARKVLLPPTRALSFRSFAIVAPRGVGGVNSRAVHWLADLDTDTCSGWECRRCEWLCAASSSRQERLCLARSTPHARSAQSPAAAERRPARGSTRARSGPCATANPAVSTLASCHRHQRCQSAAPLPLCTKFRSKSRRLHRATTTNAARVPRRCPSAQSFVNLRAN